MDELYARLFVGLPEPDGEAMEHVARRSKEVLRPVGALERLDEIAVWLAGWQRTSTPSVSAPAAIVFAADHGVAAGGVSASHRRSPQRCSARCAPGWPPPM